jgi:hypothetical protein
MQVRPELTRAKNLMGIPYSQTLDLPARHAKKKYSSLLQKKKKCLRILAPNNNVQKCYW